MKIQCWSIGKAHESYIKEGVDMFSKRVSNYFPIEWVLIPPPKTSGSEDPAQVQKKEAEVILSRLKNDDCLILLDERGRQLTSEGLAAQLQQRANESRKNVIFLIGGAYGVSEEIRKRADLTWGLSQLVFPHQLVRLILSEQLYRACSILRNEKYHH